MPSEELFQSSELTLGIHHLLMCCAGIVSRDGGVHMVHVVLHALSGTHDVDPDGDHSKSAIAPRGW